MTLHPLRTVPRHASHRAATWSHRASVVLVTSLMLANITALAPPPAAAVSTQTAAFTWGDGQSTPVRKTAWTGFTQVAAGGSHSLVVRADGTVWAWGTSCCGEIGDGTQGTSRVDPVQVIDSTGAPLTGVVQVAAGTKHSLALKSDGTVWAWGQNYYGQLGDGTYEWRLSAVQVKDAAGNPLTNITQVAAAERYSLAVRGSDGSVFAWGNGYNGQFGNGTAGNGVESTVPVKASILGVAQVAAGEKHVVAVKTDGTVWTWGGNTTGQLGNGTETDIGNPVPTPIPVPAIGLTSIIAVAAGDEHSAALKSDGTVWTWGGNFYAQLGDGTSGYDHRLIPGQVAGLTGVTGIAAGWTHTVVVKGDGTVFGWGKNDVGQVGNVPTSYSRVYNPSQVPGFTGVSGVIRVTAGGNHSLAIVEDVTPPDTVIDTGPTAVTNATGASFDFQATGMYATEGDLTFECRLDSTAWGGCTSPKSYTGLSAGSHTFLVRATDTAGNTDPSPAQQTWVIDTTAPNTMIDSGPAGVTNATTATFTLDSTETGSTFACRLDSGGWAGCTSPKTYTGLAEGWHVFEVRATDPASNTDPSPAQHAWTIDTTAPVLHLPVAIAADATSASGATVDYTATATDAIDSGVTAVCVPASGSTFAVGTTTVNCSATDAAGNQATGSFTVTVTDTPPELTLPDDMTLEATGPNGVPVTYTATATDAGDGTLPAVCTLPSGGMAPLGDTLVVCRAVDSAGNAVLDSFVVTVVDTTGPVLNVMAIDVAATSAAGATVDFTGTATDAVDGDVPLVCNPASGSTFALGTTTVECSATDSRSNRSTGSFTVTVTDTGPALILPDDQTVEATGPTGAVVDYTATATDAVDGTLTPVCDPASGSTFALGTTTVSCSATDSVQNVTTDSFTVTVQHTTGPVLTLPANMTAEATGPRGAVVDYTATASDAVDGDVTPVCEPASGSRFALATTTVQCTASDSAGNQASGSFTVTVTDTTPPVLTLPADMTAVATGPSGAAVSYAATATDAVEGLRPVACNPASGATFGIGTTTVQCSASDSLGNEATGGFTVTVTDTEPVLLLPDDMTVAATSAAGAVVDYTATATDAVDGNLIPVCNPGSGAPFALGTTTVNCSATDSAGNQATGSFTVTVTDTGPVLGLPDDMTVEATGPAGAPVDYTATATDAVDGTLTPVCTLPSGGTAPLGDTLVVCRAVDSAGNQTLDSFVVTVVDTTGPVLSLTVIDVAATSAAGAVVDYTATAADAVDGPRDVICDPASGSTFALGTTTVECSATDSRSNRSTGSFTVTVTDTGPALILPDDQTVEATGPAGAVVDYTATATDAVDGTLTPVCGPPSGSTFAIGTTTVGCSATDSSDNLTTGSFTITVTDTTAPVLSLPEDIALTYQGKPKDAGIVLDYTATATDIVDGPLEVVCDPLSGAMFPMGSTTVYCSATDTFDNESTGTFTVTVSRVGGSGSEDPDEDVDHGRGRGGPKKN